jgi:translocation and assembly module TamA
MTLATTACRPRRAPRGGPALLVLLAFAGPGLAVAAIRIDIEGVDAELRRNVQALLSLERYKDRERIEPDAIERLFRRVPGEVGDALRPYGYYEPKVTTHLEPEDKGRNWRVSIAIEPGEPVRLQEVHVEVQGPGGSDPLFTRITAAPGLRRGEPLRHADYEQLKSDLQGTAVTYGYLDARLLRSELQVDPEAHTASVQLVLESGPRYHFGVTTIEQSAISPGLARRYLRYAEGEPYDAGKLLRTQFALDDSQYFSTVELSPGARDPETLTVPLTIRGTSARNTYSFGPGYGTDTGARVTVGMLIPHVNQLGHRLRVLAQVSQIVQNYNVQYDMPFGDPVLEKFSLQFLTQTEYRSSGVDTREVAFRPSLTQSLGRWQRSLFVSAAREQTFERDLPANVYDVPTTDQMIVPGISYSRVPEGYLGEELFSRSLYIELVGSHFDGTASRYDAATARIIQTNKQTNFARLDIRSEGVVDLSASWHLLLRAELGASAVDNFDSLPSAYRFFAGGDRSVRGFALDGLSPVGSYPVRVLDPATGVISDSAIAERVGGRHLLTGTVELERDLPRKFGAAVFVDGGNAFDRIGDPLALSFGVGLRWRLPVVTVGIDIAKAVHAPGYDSIPGPRIHLNISPKL